MTETEEQTLNTKSSTAMEVESQRGKKTKKPLYKRPCCGITAAVILLLLIVLIILIFTVFKTKDPTMKVESITVTGVSPRVTLPAVRVELNITLNVDMSIHNPNYASFRAANGTSQVYYSGVQVADVVTYPGNIRARKTSGLSARLTVQADKVDISSLVRDVLAGQMSMEVQTRVPGKAKILGFITKHVVSYSTCQIDIGFPSLDVVNQECKNKAKL